MIEWTATLDDKLLQGISRGLSTTEVAWSLGPKFTKNMVIGRHKRLRGIVHESERLRGVRTQEERERRICEHIQFLAVRVAEIDRQLKVGLLRDFVIACARRAGLTFEEIGLHFGLTRERIRQICGHEGVERRHAA